MANDGWTKVEMSPTWTPEKVNDELVGVLTAKEENVGPNNSRLYTVEKENGESVSVWGSTVLDTRMKNISLGEELKIVYLGLEDSLNRKGSQYKVFDVFHKKTAFTKVDQKPDQEEKDFIDDVEKAVKGN